MNKGIRQSVLVVVSGLLLIGIIVLLSAYFLAVRDLPSQIYTKDQEEYLFYTWHKPFVEAYNHLHL